MATRSHTSRGAGPDLQPYVTSRNNYNGTNSKYSYSEHDAPTSSYGAYPSSVGVYSSPPSQYHISSNAGEQDNRGKHGADRDGDDSGRHDRDGDPGSGPPPPPRRAPHETSTRAQPYNMYTTSAGPAYVLARSPDPIASPPHPDYVPRYQGISQYQGPSQGPQAPSPYPPVDRSTSHTRTNIRMTDNKRSKRQKRDSDTSDSDDSSDSVHFFVPGETIDVDALTMYITEFIDPTARITQGSHPTDKTRTGYHIAAKNVLNGTHLRDLASDSKDWNTEKSSKSFKREPYRYKYSDTWKRRIKAPRASSNITSKS